MLINELKAGEKHMMKLHEHEKLIVQKILSSKLVLTYVDILRELKRYSAHNSLC